MRKMIAMIIGLVLLGAGVSGCGKKAARLNPGVSPNLVVLTKDGDLPNQTLDQMNELDRVIGWMDRDLLASLKRAGFNASLIKNRSDYKPADGDLLVVDVESFNAGNRAMRAFVGFGAGASSLDLDYKLINSDGIVLKEWKDGVGSSKGGTYCAQTLNRNSVGTLTAYFNK